MRLSSFLKILCLLLLINLNSFALAQSACEPAGDVQFICGLVNAEDLYHIHDTPWVIASSMNSPTQRSGGLFLLHTEEKRWQMVDISFPENTSTVEPIYAGCPSVPDKDLFSAHGINLRKKNDDQQELYVVNHGGRESIEVFHINTAKQVPSINWVGCILTPDNSFINSLVPLPYNGLAVTNILDPSDSNAVEKLIAGRNTGYVLEWFPDTGWYRLPDSELSGNNGIEVSPDGEWLYIAGWGDGTLTRVSRTKTPMEKKTVDLNFRADNIRWSSDGSLLVAGQEGDVEDVFACISSSEAICKLGYGIAMIDPDTLEIMRTLSRPGTKFFGAATSAIRVHDELWIGTFRGNRVARIALKK